MRRRALLLAIAGYDKLPALGYVANDIPRIKAALARAGFDPRLMAAAGAVAGETQALELTTNRLMDEISEFLESAQEHDDMLVFVSGHGIEIDGHRVVLPTDYNPRRPRGADDLVSDSWLSRQARICKARSVLVLIDTCREGARVELAAAKSAAPAEWDKDTPLTGVFAGDGTDGPTIAFFYSCAGGEQSGRDTQGADCSAFTRAFSEAIELENGPAELGGVVEDARRRLVGYGGGKQKLVASGRAGRGGAWESLIIKDDEAARFRERLARSEWSCHLQETELFRKVEESLPAFAAQLRAIAMRAEELVAEARLKLPAQNWRDEGAWRRQATRCLNVFLAQGLSGEALAPEAAVLLAVPFVYEATLASVETKLSAAGAVPDPEAANGAGYLVNAWRNAWRASDAAQIRHSLILRNQERAAADHACWSLVDFCHNSGELWDAQGGTDKRSGWALDVVTALIAPAPLPEIADDHRVREILSVPRLLRLARLMFASFDDVTLDASGGSRILDPQVSSGEFSEQVTINEVRLAHLLNLGSHLALDPRRLPPLVAEHIGTDDTLSAEWIRSQLARAEWHERASDGVQSEQDIRWFDLKLDCAHDAVDAALLAVVDALESYRTRLLQRQDVHAVSMRDLLPAGFTVNRLNAGPSGWRPTRPPLRFELDRTRIINLLMGQQLYGEKWPALREVYQNALDACRYRRAAERLAVDEGRTPSSRPYAGRIVIRLGSHGHRRYVECVDDGIGMAARHVRRLFACAGQRFADSHEFHIDRARWDVAGIPFFPNSRFGVGVLSYFMLAEELDIVSRRWAPPTERWSAPIRATIIGSGSLFRLDSIIDPTRLADDFGTSVRLYLRGDAPEHAALVQSILNWLWLAEVAVSIQHEGREPIEIAVGQPTDTFRAARGKVLLPLPGSESTKGVARVYIAPCAVRAQEYVMPPLSEWDHDEVALADGIATGLREDSLPRSIVGNLTEDLGVTLTVDRRRAAPDDAAITQIWKWIRQNGGITLASWRCSDFFALHTTLDELGPRVVVDTDIALRRTTASDVDLMLPGTGLRWPLSEAGVSDVDADIACDLMSAFGLKIFAQEVSGGRYQDGGMSPSALRSRLIRPDLDEAIHPIADWAVLCRVSELADSGLKLPTWLKRAASFDAQVYPCRVPVSCRPILIAINANGQIFLRDVLEWLHPDQLPVFSALRAIVARCSRLLPFDLDRLDTLGPLHRKLCLLSSGNELASIDLIYFSRLEAMPLAEVLVLAEELQSYGLKIPNLSEVPSDLGWTERQQQVLSGYFALTAKSSIWNRPQSLEALSAWVGSSGSIPRDEVRTELAPLMPWFGSQSDDESPVLDNLDYKQMCLLSRDLDADPPFLNRMTQHHLFAASLRPEFGGLAHAIPVAQSLAGTGVDLSCVQISNDNVIAQADAIPLRAKPFASRLFDALDRKWAASAWDLAIAATAANIEPAGLNPILDLVESWGGDVLRCREFIAFCASSGSYV